MGGMAMVRLTAELYTVVKARAAAEQRTVQAVVERAVMAGLGVEAGAATAESARVHAEPRPSGRAFHPMPKAKSLR
jgi:hypothetical protein